MLVKELQPRIIWEQFDAITKVPRPSKKEGKIIDFLIAFAQQHGLEWQRDAIGNVVMRKPCYFAVTYGYGMREKLGCGV